MENIQKSNNERKRKQIASGAMHELKNGINKYPIPILIAGGLLVCLVVFYTIFATPNQDRIQSIEHYTLVPDKISASAAITVRLPENVSDTNFNPSQSLSFSPEIKGTWETPTSKEEGGVYRFLPEQKLTVGAYHLLSLDAKEMKMEKMFSIDSDPSVLAVFPKTETEVNEYANITIMFSRPMVPLSTLSINADIAPPVEISPKTEGRFKWITTRTLQFIPTNRLLRSSTYSINVHEGFSSLDGVKVLPFVHTFTTRALNYQSRGEDYAQEVSLTHDQPFRVYFNQPLDLEKTQSKITLFSN